MIVPESSSQEELPAELRERRRQIELEQERKIDLPDTLFRRIFWKQVERGI